MLSAWRVYGLDLISVTDRTGAQAYFLYEGHGSTANLGGSGNTTTSYSYDVFGAIRSESGSGAAANEWRFTGEQRDSDSSLYYLRARYYDPAIGRFLSQDPVPANNLYLYVGNNPANFTDPSGRCIICPPCIMCPLIEDALQEGADQLAGQLPEGIADVPLLPQFPCSTWQLCGTCVAHPIDCHSADQIRDYATHYANLVFPCDETNPTDDRCQQGTIGSTEGPDRHDKNDRFRHCFGSGKMTLEFGAGLAERLATRYEATGRFKDQSRYDLESNQRGREFADSIRGDANAERRLARFCKE